MTVAYGVEQTAQPPNKRTAITYDVEASAPPAYGYDLPDKEAIAKALARHQAQRRAAELRASRNEQRRALKPLPKPIATHEMSSSKQYWFGSPEFYSDLTSEGKQNAALAYELAKREPWFSRTEIGCLDNMWYRESNWKEDVDGGIPQAKPASKMAEFGGDYLTNPRPQILWGFDYITHQRKDYGDPCTAWSLWQSRNPHWY